MGLISEELEASNKYKLEVDDDGLVKLTKDNVAKVEAMISTDSKYKNTIDEENSKFSAYWLRQLKTVLIDNEEKSEDGYEYEEIIEKLVNAIDAENSTHLNSDGYGRESVKEKILEIEKNDFIRYLKQPNDKYELINIIQTPSKKFKNEKHHFSFATKFCHYSCIYLFKGTKAEDNFSIYDNIVKTALPKYIKKYLKRDVKISEYENNYSSYIRYIDAIREVLKQNGESISRNGFDHLIWYFHKGN